MKSSTLATLLWVAATSLFEPANCQPSSVHDTPENWENPTVVYRGDGRGPKDIKIAGGFLPRLPTPVHDAAYSLVNHAENWHKVRAQIRDWEEQMKIAESGKGTPPKGKKPVFDSRYVSTSASYEQTFDYIKDKKPPGTVYMIKTTPNAIDMNKSYQAAGRALGQVHGGANACDREFAFLEGIGWKQIMAWKKAGDQAWTLNPDYSPIFNKFMHGGPHKELMDPKNTHLRESAMKIMLSDQMRAAEAAGAAPSFCGKHRARNAKRQLAWVFTQDADGLYETRWGPAKSRA